VKALHMLSHSLTKSESKSIGTLCTCTPSTTCPTTHTRHEPSSTCPSASLDPHS